MSSFRERIIVNTNTNGFESERNKPEFNLLKMEKNWDELTIQERNIFIERFQLITSERPVSVTYFDPTKWDEIDLEKGWERRNITKNTITGWLIARKIIAGYNIVIYLKEFSFNESSNTRPYEIHIEQIPEQLIIK